MRAFLFIAVGILSTGCAAKLAIVEVPSSAIRSFGEISRDRTSWRLTISNSSRHDVFCKRVTVRVIFDDPRDYLEKAELVQVITDKYLRSNQSTSVAGGVPEDHPSGATHVRSISAVDPDCASATVFHFCQYGVKSEKER